MSSFGVRHINRMIFPRKKIIVCEDDLMHQMEIAEHLLKLFGRQSHVEVTFTSSGAAAASIINTLQHVSLIILDHDMPYGNGSDLITWLYTEHKHIPVITFSGIPENNAHMKKLMDNFKMQNYQFNKDDVIHGNADKIILEIIKQEEVKCGVEDQDGEAQVGDQDHTDALGVPGDVDQDC